MTERKFELNNNNNIRMLSNFYLFVLSFLFCLLRFCNVLILNAKTGACRSLSAYQFHSTSIGGYRICCCLHDSYFFDEGYTLALFLRIHCINRINYFCFFKKDYTKQVTYTGNREERLNSDGLLKIYFHESFNSFDFCFLFTLL